MTTPRTPRRLREKRKSPFLRAPPCPSASSVVRAEPTDAATLGGVAVALLVVAAVASLVPARASTRIEPVVALRAE